MKHINRSHKIFDILFIKNRKPLARRSQSKIINCIAGICTIAVCTICSCTVEWEVKESRSGKALPKLTTTEATNITATSASIGGNITNAGTSPYTERGVCYSTSQNPTTANNKTPVAGAGTGNFITTVSGLTINTTYYVRAYAINPAGTAYGGQVSFKTSGNLPALTTAAATNITATSATLGGNITNAGTPPYTERGVCFFTSQNPTIANNKRVFSGTGTESFNIDVSGLSPNTTYYARAYATNMAGTAYGDQVSFRFVTN